MSVKNICGISGSRLHCCTSDYSDLQDLTIKSPQMQKRRPRSLVCALESPNISEVSECILGPAASRSGRISARRRRCRRKKTKSRYSKKFGVHIPLGHPCPTSFRDILGRHPCATSLWDNGLGLDQQHGQEKSFIV